MQDATTMFNNMVGVNNTNNTFKGSDLIVFMIVVPISGYTTTSLNFTVFLSNGTY